MSADQGSEGQKWYVELARKGFRTISKVSRWSRRIRRAANFAFNFWTVIHQADNQVVQDLLLTFFGG